VCFKFKRERDRHQERESDTNRERQTERDTEYKMVRLKESEDKNGVQQLREAYWFTSWFSNNSRLCNGPGSSCPEAKSYPHIHTRINTYAKDTYCV